MYDEGLGIGGFNWNLAAINNPYAVCCLVFAFSMIPAGIGLFKKPSYAPAGRCLHRRGYGQ